MSIDQGWVGTVLPKVLLRWMPSRLSPLVVAAVSAAAAAAADDDDDDDDGGVVVVMMMMMMMMTTTMIMMIIMTTMMMLFWDLHTCSTRSPVNGKTTHVDDKPCPPRYPSRRH